MLAGKATILMEKTGRTSVEYAASLMMVVALLVKYQGTTVRSVSSVSLVDLKVQLEYD
jgi:hypothetical protein